MSTATEVLNQALNLSDGDRALVARQLLLSLESDDFDADSDSLWAAEIEARIAAVDRGEYTASDWREAIARIRSSLPRRGGP